MAKRTYFTLKDLVSFGNYVLSEQREKRYRELNEINPNIKPYETRHRSVSDADLANWKDEQTKA